MAEVYWPDIITTGLSHSDTSTFLGFNFRDILVYDIGGYANSYTSDSYSISIINIYYSAVSDTYSGRFTYDGNGSATGSYITHFRRGDLNQLLNIHVDFLEARAASLTPSRDDDMTLWAKAFSGNDTLSTTAWRDTLEGFAGNDRLHGGSGADNLYGGSGSDTFIFTSLKDSYGKKAFRDTIYDFSHREGDKIDLTTIDARTKIKGNQPFKYIGKQDFHKKPGEVRWEKVKGGVYVHGDVNGDGKADLSIFLANVAKLVKSDFYL